MNPTTRPKQGNARRCLLLSILCLMLAGPSPIAAKRKDKIGAEIRPHVCAMKTYQFIDHGVKVEAPKGKTFILVRWKVLKEKHYLDVDYSSFLLHDQSGATHRALETDTLTIFKTGTGQLDVAFEVPNSTPYKDLKVTYKNTPPLMLSFDEDDIETNSELPCASVIMDFEQERIAERERMLDAFHKCLEDCVKEGRRSECPEECKAIYPEN